MSSISHNNDVMDWIKLVSKLNYKESLSNDDDSVGGLNHTPHLVTPLLLFKISFVTKSCHLYGEL
jgi:hypothetical protein